MPKPKPQKDDLIIGENQWITYIQHDWRNAEWMFIDKIIEPIFPLFDLLETECVAACCGLDAFSFFPECIISASEKLDRNLLHDSLDYAINEIGQLSENVLGSHHLNNGFDRGTFLELLEHLKNSIPTSKSA